MQPTLAFDYVIVGGGSAGAVLANRLSQSKNTRVLVLEAGPDYRSGEAPDAMRSPNHNEIVGRSEFRWPALEAVLVEGQRRSPYEQGRGVGGSSAINALAAMRALPTDFEEWDDPIWTWPRILSAFVRLENDSEFGSLPYHGSDGPLPIRRVPQSEWGAVSAALRDASIRFGHAWQEDINAPVEPCLAPQTWNYDGRNRVSTNDAYLESARARRNLVISGSTLVDRVQIENGRAVGVWTNDAFVEAGEVLLCAGALQSPALLVRSGIGDSTSLRRLGINPVQHLPGVGKDLQDHPRLVVPIDLRPSAWRKSISLPIGAVCLRWEEDISADVGIWALDMLSVEPGAGGLLVALLAPKSRGHLEFRSSDPQVAPLPRFHLLDHPDDLRRLRAAVKHAAILLRDPSFRVVGAPAIDGGLPGDDDNLDRWLRSQVKTFAHAAGTCRMGSVVDSACRVRGIESLRVVDASVLPVLPRATPLLTVVMLAERIADLLITETN
jgi:5-(hydroxymethyl)furfural/furfural oxidase